MTLRTWNILADCHVRASWYPLVAPADLDPAVRWPRVRTELARAEEDVVCLQEVAPDRLEAVRAALAPRQLAFVPHNGEGLVIASRLPFFGVETPQVGRKRALVVQLANGRRVACVHLSFAGPDTTERPGLAQLEAVLRLGPDIIAGDFNAFPDWPERRLAVGRGYTDLGPTAPTCNVHRWLQPLDAVMVRPPLRGRVSPVQMISADEPMPSAVFASDHLPVRVELEG